MDSNHLNQNQQPAGTEPENNQASGYEGSAYQSGDAYSQGNTYQSGDAYQGSAYQSGDAYSQGNTYQSGDAYSQGNAYQSGDAYSQGSAYQNNGAYQQSSYNQYESGGSYQNSYGSGNYSNNSGSYQNGNYAGGYGNGSYQAPYQSSQLDLEEPVKMSEWLISMLLMIVPCVNIVMMFVWAFSKTEKKSKSNFFKAYLILFGIAFGLYFLVIMFVVAAGVSGVF